VALVLYHVEIDEAELQHFTSSEECVAWTFVNEEEAKNLPLNPEVQKFLKVFDPEII
jgi:hypothetical protein